MKYIDVHCHLAAVDFDTDRADVIARARDAGLEAAVVVGEFYEDNLRVLELAAKDHFVRPALGHHPWFYDRGREDVPRTLKLIEENVSRLVAVGEVGLDYRVAETLEARQEQRAIFREMIEAAKVFRLPLSVHVRSAGHYVIDLLDAHGAPPAALHAFDGKVGYALRGAAMGFYFSIPPTVFYSQQKRKLARALPLDRLLLESDAPALGPAPGMRSEPGMVPRVAAEVASLRGVPMDVIAKAAAENALRLFGPVTGDFSSFLLQAT